MATVVITFFLLTRFYVYKMDAVCIDIQRDPVLSRREKRWSMNSQRLEEIVAELMKPISDVRRSFDTDLSALLEEYLTEAGLHALEADEHEPAAAAPNFAELALLLQHSASVYGRKVDFLYQHVLSVSDSLLTSTQELERSAETPGAGEAEAGGRRRRRASAAAAAAFGALELSACAGSVREPSAARPPPTLPRVYIELEPRQLTPADRPLTDYDGEPVGLLADFHVAWRLQAGLLVDELEGWGGAAARGLRPIPLMELQAAIEAAAPPALPPPDPPAPPPPPTPPTPPASPLHASTPLPAGQPDAPVKRERKRRSDVSTDDLVGGCFKIKIIMTKELRRKLRKLEEFSVDSAWIAGVVASRRQLILESRQLLSDDHLASEDFRGFDACDSDVGGESPAVEPSHLARDVINILDTELVAGGSDNATRVRRLELDGGGGGDGWRDDHHAGRGRRRQRRRRVLRAQLARRLGRVARRRLAAGGGRRGRRGWGRGGRGGVGGGRGGARGGGRGARPGRGGPGAPRAAAAAARRPARARRARALRRAAGGRRARRRRRARPLPGYALPGERGQRGGDPGPAADAELVLGAAAVHGRAAVLGGGARRPALPAVNLADLAGLADLADFAGLDDLVGLGAFRLRRGRRPSRTSQWSACAIERTK